MIDFFKMEGAGNDYIYTDILSGEQTPELFTPTLIMAMSNRSYGIGSDGLVIIAPSRKADARMIMSNADGSPSAMCGNALRCMAYYLCQKTGKDHFILESDAGYHQAQILEKSASSARVEIEMNAPKFLADDIPFDPTVLELKKNSGPFIDLPLQLFFDHPHNAQNARNAQTKKLQSEIPGDLKCSLVSVGNPHCVIFVKDADEIPVRQLGAFLETHPAFPERTNVEFVSIEKGGLYQRTFERGSGETLACGSGACAVQAVARIKGLSSVREHIRLRGGSLELVWEGPRKEEEPMKMIGPARMVYRGEFDPDAFLI